MRIASAKSTNGDSVFGVLQDDHLHVLNSDFADVITLLAAVSDSGQFSELNSMIAEASTIPLAEIELTAPIEKPPRILCVGRNYVDHITELDSAGKPEDYPTLFTRFASSMVGPSEPLVRPRASTNFDYEGELAIVIGSSARRVAAEKALEVVAGYSCFLDGSIRDFQRHTTQFTPGKNFDRTGAWGPSIVTTDEVPDPSSLTLTTTVSGEVLQRSSTDLMIFDVAAIISYCSTFTTLQPGDVIATGTPSGVGLGRTPHRWLVAGDEVTVSISGIGDLVNPVVDE